MNAIKNSLLIAGLFQVSPVHNRTQKWKNANQKMEVGE